MKKVLKNTFSWSISRDNTFQECPRKYYFNYYGHWGGWGPNAPERVRWIYMLKQLKNRHIWIGQVVHECIARSLQNISRGIPVLPLKEILDITRDRMRQDYRNSKKKLHHQNPTAYSGLFEHEYEIPLSQPEWKETAEQVDDCLRTFYDSVYFDRFSNMRRDDFLEIEQFSSFQLDGITINIKLDCANREDNQITVWDWKTGKSKGTGLTLQMACYAYYAGQTFAVDPTDVVTREFYLTDGTVNTHSATNRSLEELLSYIRGSISDMMGLLDDVKENIAVEERFAKVEKRNICLKCNFLKVCHPDI